MTRKNGFYWVKLAGHLTIAQWNECEWYVLNDKYEKGDGYFDEIDETPILRPQSTKLHSTSQTLGTLKETLADFPDTLLVTQVYIEMHNKFSVQITEFNTEGDGKQ